MLTVDQKHIIYLLGQVAKDSQPAFKQLYDLFAASLHQAAFVYTKDVHLAEEIVQESFIRLWQNRHKLNDLKSLENYLFIIARNLALDHFRQKVVRSKGLEAFVAQKSGVSEDLRDLVSRKEYAALYEQAIATMPQQQRIAYILVEEEQLSYQDAASQMQISRLTVKRHLELARKFLRAYFRKHAPTAILLLRLWDNNF